MGGVALLTREGEREIAMRIEQSRTDIKRIILSVPLTIKELVRALPALKAEKMDLKEITSEVDEEDESGFDLDVQRDMIVALLENLKEKSQRMRKTRKSKEKETLQAEIWQIISDINLSGRMIERISVRMKRHIGKIEKLEQEIKSLGRPRGEDREKRIGEPAAESLSERSAKPGCRPGNSGYRWPPFRTLRDNAFGPRMN